MTIVAELFNFVVGVDTHAVTHTYSVVDGRTGAERQRATFPTSPAGLSRAVSWIQHHSTGKVLVVVEGAGSYGAHLLEHLTGAGLEACEPSSPMPTRRGQGKSDELDAGRIARSVLGVNTALLRRPRADTGPRVALRGLGRRTSRTQQRPDPRHQHPHCAHPDRRSLIDTRRPLTATQIRSIAAWRAREEPDWLATCRAEAVRLSRHIGHLNTQLRDNRAQLDQLVDDQAPHLTTLPGVGAVVAAAVLIAWSHPGRVRTEAAFAAIAGTCPIPASSGNTTRHRLNRGDRRLNHALHTIVLVRMRIDPATRTYVARRRAQGRTTKEIMRSLKRYVTRELFRALPRSLE